MSGVPPFNIKLLANRIDVSGSIHAKGDVAVDCSLSVGGDTVLNNVTINNANFLVKISTLETTVAALQTTLAAMDERLKALESS